MSTPAWKPLPVGLQDDDPHVGVAAGGAQRVGELEPARDGQRVHGRVVDGHGRDVRRASPSGSRAGAYARMPP